MGIGKQTTALTIATTQNKLAVRAWMACAKVEQQQVRGDVSWAIAMILLIMKCQNASQGR